MLFNAHGYVIYIHNINTIVQERYFTTICHRSRDWKEVNHIFGRCTGSWQHAWALMDRQWLNLELITLDCHNWPHLQPFAEIMALPRNFDE
jgi:hypothetical protein